MKGAPTIDFSAEFSALSRELCCRVPELQHINSNQVLFCLSRSRAQGRHGTYARIVPLRFANGVQELCRRRGLLRETYRLPSLTHENNEILYLIYVFVPRFLRLSAEEKLRTIVHELFHISDRFDGDIRRFAGRNYAHGSSRRKYNQRVDSLIATFLQTSPPEESLSLLQMTEQDWSAGKFRLVGLNIPLPKAKLVARTLL